MWMGRLGEMEGYLEGGAPEFLLQQKQTSGQSQIEDRAAGSWRNLHGGWEERVQKVQRWEMKALKGNFLLDNSAE